jgi:hypothetical protein
MLHVNESHPRRAQWRRWYGTTRIVRSINTLKCKYFKWYCTYSFCSFCRYWPQPTNLNVIELKRHPSQKIPQLAVLFKRAQVTIGLTRRLMQDSTASDIASNTK